MLMGAGVTSISLEVGLVLGPGTCLTCKTDKTTGHLDSLLSQQPHFPGSGEIMGGKPLWLEKHCTKYPIDNGKRLWIPRDQAG